MSRRYFGKIVGGGLTGGLRGIICMGENIEDYPVGAMVSIVGRTHRYLAMITDVRIESTDATVGSIMSARIPTDVKEITINALEPHISSKWIELALIAQSDEKEIKNADTVPSFYSDIVDVGAEDIKCFFGGEDMYRRWNIGRPKTPKGVEVEIPIDVEKLVELSFGIFGKSGTGKTFLGNIIAGYIVMFDLIRAERDPFEKRIKLLIFDMHSEYALELRDNMGNIIADGVAKIFSENFIRYTPDVELAKERGLRMLRINYGELTVDDIRLILPMFGVSGAFSSYLPDYRNILARKIGLGDLWVWGLIIDEHVEERLQDSREGRTILDEISKRTGTDVRGLRTRILQTIRREIGLAAELSFRAQTAKLRALINYPYTARESQIDEIVNNLTSRNGSHITISLGRYEKETPLYMIIANLIARRLRQRILKKSVAGEELETKIVIFLEEAHNFLGKETYRLSPFGAIAREMRKKGVMLCVIDQKPGELDSDVISMLWTNFVFTLTDRNDIEAALMGAPRKELLKKIIEILGRREVLIYGEGVTFPVVIRVRDYGDVARIFEHFAKRMTQIVEERVEHLREHGFV